MASSNGRFPPDSPNADDSRRLKRRRTSDRPSLTTEDRPIPADSSSLSRERTTSASSRDTMYHLTSSSVPPGDIRFTKTGRVSKATKGERVHACDECERVYTRAEHLRRHKKNHSPGAFPCDVPGCGRSFFREDLLVRHKQRGHNLNDPTASSSRRPSHDSQASDHPPKHPIPSINNAVPRATNLAAHASQRTIPEATNSSDRNRPDFTCMGFDNGQPLNPKSKSVGRTMNYAPIPTVVSTTTGMVYSSPWAETLTSMWPESPPVSPGYASPNQGTSSSQPYYQPQPQRGRNTSTATLLGYPHHTNVSRSPVSVDSGLALVSTVAIPPHATISTPSSDASRGAPIITHADSAAAGPARWSSASPLPFAVEERDLMEQLDLQTPTATMASSDFGPHLDLSVFDSEQRYISSYWQIIHPVWSVLHKPSFDLQTATPLLRASMIALGAQSSGDVTDLTNARILHERCLKVIKKRTDKKWHTFRVCDMQAMVLTEIYSLFRSRRPLLQLSRSFEDVYRRLANDTEAYPLLEESGQAHRVYIEETQRKCKQRLLVACYILDRQQSMFFGRHKSVCLSISGEYLPFPQPCSLWDVSADAAVLRSTPQEEAHYDYTYQAMSAVPMLVEIQSYPHDIFRSMHMIACLDDDATGQMLSTWRPIDDTETSTILLAVEQSPRAKLAYHTFMLCKHTPVRDLLAVAGESWVMAEKLTSQGDYSAAQLEVSSWARNTAEGVDSSILQALRHALQILDIYRAHPRMGLLFQEWSIYLAALVVWIRSYVSSEAQPHRRMSATELYSSTHELEQTVIATIQASAPATITWKGASSVLFWTKGRIEQVNVPHNCGLINGALDVLGKLVAHGHEDNWLR